MTRTNGIIFVVGAAMMAAHLPAVASTPQSHAAADNDETAKEIISEDAQAWAQSILKSCQQQQQQQQQQSSSSSISIKDCVHQQLSHAIAATRDDISYFRQVRTRQGSQWEDYACEDFALETSPALEERVWVDPATTSGSEAPNDKPVRVLHDYSSSQIHVLEDFISPDECDAILQESEDYLHRAKVHDGKGGDHFSDHRKAWQAGIEVDWDYELEEDNAYYSAEEMVDHYIAKVSRRVYDYTNHVLPGLDISHPGQENLMSIQYFGNNKTTTEPPDRYAPHCDGECNGRPHKRGTRMATMVMYWYVLFVCISFVVSLAAPSLHSSNSNITTVKSPPREGIPISAMPVFIFNPKSVRPFFLVTWIPSLESKTMDLPAILGVPCTKVPKRL